VVVASLEWMKVLFLAPLVVVVKRRQEKVPSLAGSMALREQLSWKPRRWR
jgi:hypothetical protein